MRRNTRIAKDTVAKAFLINVIADTLDPNPVECVTVDTIKTGGSVAMLEAEYSGERCVGFVCAEAGEDIIEPEDVHDLKRFFVRVPGAKHLVDLLLVRAYQQGYHGARNNVLGEEIRKPVKENVNEKNSAQVRSGNPRGAAGSVAPAVRGRVHR